jgi:hypothetical protein
VRACTNQPAIDWRSVAVAHAEASSARQSAINDSATDRPPASKQDDDDGVPVAAVACTRVEMRHLSAPSTSQLIRAQSLPYLRRRTNAVIGSDRAFEAAVPCVAHVAHCEFGWVEWLLGWLAALSIASSSH